jgi:hypothetical protein
MSNVRIICPSAPAYCPVCGASRTARGGMVGAAAGKEWGTYACGGDWRADEGGIRWACRGKLPWVTGGTHEHHA